MGRPERRTAVCRVDEKNEFRLNDQDGFMRLIFQEDWIEICRQPLLLDLGSIFLVHCEGINLRITRMFSREIGIAAILQIYSSRQGPGSSANPGPWSGYFKRVPTRLSHRGGSGLPARSKPCCLWVLVKLSRSSPSEISMTLFVLPI